MKTVFSNDMVAHIWANQTQNEGRNANGSSWFRGDTLYSYQTPIARIVESPETGDDVVLITSRSYSKTTNGKHVPRARLAVFRRNNPVSVFTVPDVGEWSGYPHAGADKGAWRRTHDINVEYLQGQYEKEKLRQSRSNTMRPHNVFLADVYTQLYDYANTFKLMIIYPDREADEAEIRAKLGRPERIARLDAAAAEREAKEADRQLAAALQGAEKREKWIAGVFSGRCDCPSGGAMLRVDKDELITSWGARVPLDHALAAFKLIARHLATKSTEAVIPGEGFRVGHFKIDAVYPDGAIDAGCHRIYWQEMERVAATIPAAA